MDKIKRQVAVARRRMTLQQFVLLFPGVMFLALLIAIAGLAVPKLWVLEVEGTVWLWSWVGGAIGAGMLVAFVWTYLRRRDGIEAAIEIDRRFGLKERVSSALALQPEEFDSPIGRALVDDAIRRIERIEVREHFSLFVPWRTLLPVLPAAAIFALVLFVPDATRQEEAVASVPPERDTPRVQRAAQELKKRLTQSEKKADEQGLKDTDILFKQLQQGLDELTNKENVDRKEALIKLNDLAKNLEQRRDRLGGADKIREQLANLKNLPEGPADKMANAIKEGDFGKAAEELKKLRDAVKNDQLTDEQKAELAKQMEKVEQKMKNLADAHEQAKRELQEEIERREKAGDEAGADKARRQLDQFEALNDQMNRMRRMADKLNQCQQALNNRDADGAAARLDELGDELKAIQAEMDQLETLEEALEQLTKAKDAMACDKCNGEGCAACLGAGGNGDKKDGPPGFGLGKGRGQGDRPEQETNTGFYDTQVRAKPKAGEAVVAGTADGPNRAGRTRESVTATIQSNLSSEADPLVDARLPRKERQQAREYFDRYHNRNK